MARRDTDEDGGALDPALAQKKRARRRLVGALVLGLLAAVVLPLILDSEPRQTITDVQIEIPPRDAPLPPKAAAEPAIGEPSAPPVAPESEAHPPVPEAGQRAGAEAARRSEPAKANGAAKAADAGKPADTAKSAETAKSADAAKSASAVRPDGARAADAAKPSSQSKTPPASADAGRFALQIGAYASSGSARAQADKARKAGVRVYTETVQTAQGERTRVRVGPFATRDAADEARAKLKLIGVDSAVVAL
jgi:DedD protein